MSRIDLVREYVEKHFADLSGDPDIRGVEASEVANALGIWRNDASADLKRLYELGLLQKYGKRPVLYYPANISVRHTEGPQPSAPSPAAPIEGRQGYGAPQGGAFSHVVGADGSLKSIVQTAKAAAMYPPNGLHMLITGESGAGKSMFAEEVWRFIKEFRPASGKSVPFVVFNCAEYADNPQLLQSHLFGHAKGAFTGATADKPGLVEEAAGGVLFLDEIHRLPPIGQEMLFRLIDKGVFRRLGETGNRETGLMIIGATTEDITSVILRTFRRRIPVQVQLPSLLERPIAERIALIRHFLREEATRVNCPVFLTGPACRSIIMWQSKAGIGDLKNLLQLCCAKSYCSYLMNADQVERENHLLEIGLQEIRLDECADALDTINGLDSLDSAQLSQVFMSGILVDPKLISDPEPFSADGGQSMDMYGFVKNQLEVYQMQALPQQEIERRITQNLEDYYHNALSKLQASNNEERAFFKNLVSAEAVAAADELLTLAAVHFNCTYPHNTKMALALHLQQFLERAKAGYIDLPSRLNGIQPRYEYEVSFIRSILARISYVLDTSIPEDEVTLLAMFVRHPNKTLLQRIGIVIVAHGGSTASSITDFTSQILSLDYAVAVDVPTNRSAADTLEKLCEAVRASDCGHGVILLADMEDFITMQGEIEHQTGIQCRIIPSINMALVLEAVKQVSSATEDLDVVCTRLKRRYKEYINVLFDDDTGKSPEHLDLSDNGSWVILTICATGLGSAKKLSEFLRARLNCSHQLDVWAVGISEDIPAIAAELGGRLKAIAGSFCAPGLDIPFFSIESILMGNGLSRMEELLRRSAASSWVGEGADDTRSYALARVGQQIKRFAPSYDGEKVISAAVSIAARVGERLLKEPVETDVLVRIILHLASLLERMKASDLVSMPEWGHAWVAERSAKFETMREIVDEALKSFSYRISDAELLYFMQIL